MVSLANNHMNDFGEVPVNFTAERIHETGVSTFGVTYGPTFARQVILTHYKNLLKRLRATAPRNVERHRKNVSLRYNAETTQNQTCLTLSLQRGINFEIPLQPHQKYHIIQYEELGFS